MRAEAGPSAGSADADTYTRSPRKRKAQAAPQPARWRTQLAIVLGAVVWLLALLAMASHNAADPAWSTSGSQTIARNWAGYVGARFSDLAFFSFGFSAWWLLIVSLRAWLGGLARLLRDESGSPPADGHGPPAMAVLARPHAVAGRQLLARVHAAVPMGVAPAGATPAACSAI